jgi:hypothetical protein
VFQEIDPASEERADLRTAIIAYQIANLFKTRGEKLVPLETFMMFNKQQPKKRTAQDMQHDMLQWARTRNAAIAKKGGAS